jgi:hypothetical protein
MQQAQQQAGHVAEQAKQQITSRLESQKGRASDAMQNISEALHQAGQHLRDHGQAPVGDCMDWAAREAEQITRYIQNKSVDQFVDDAEQFARRNPAVFLGGAFALGFLAARFLKSSSPTGSDLQRDSAALPRPTSSMSGWDRPMSNVPASNAPDWKPPSSSAPGWSTPTPNIPSWSPPSSTMAGRSASPTNTPGSLTDIPSTPASTSPASTAGTSELSASKASSSTIGTSRMPASNTLNRDAQASSPGPQDSLADEDE